MASVDDGERNGTKKSMKLNPCVRIKWMPVLAILITGVFLLTGCGSDSAIQSNHSNGTPVISNLTAAKEAVFPSQQCQITCVVSDSDGDNLTYKWAANGGSISGGGSEVTWIAPDVEGTYAITVAVSNGNGSPSTSYLSIKVMETHAPVIEDLNFTPEDSDLEGLQVNRRELCEIECVASDQDGDKLSYEWSTDGGSISGEGPAVTWTAPSEVGTYNITVVVTDGQGGESRDSLTIDVVINHRPEIDELRISIEGCDDLEDCDYFNPDKMKIMKDTRCEIKCRASDEDGDKLSYEWSIEPVGWTFAGSISEDDDIAIWTAPDRAPSFVIVTVRVSDGRGGADTASLEFDVITDSACLRDK